MSLQPADESIASKKRGMTLDFSTTSARKSAKTSSSPSHLPFPFPTHQDYQRPSPVILTSPDLMMFTISTPEVERMIMQGLIGPKTPSPTGMPFPFGGALNRQPSTVAEERDLYTKGFADAMAYSSSLHRAAAYNPGVFMESRAVGGTPYPMFPGQYMLPTAPAHQHCPVPAVAGYKILPLPHLTVNTSPVEEGSLPLSNSVKRKTSFFDQSSDRSSRSPSVSVSVSEGGQTVPSPSASDASVGSVGSGGSGGSVRSGGSVCSRNDALMAVSDALMDVDASCRQRNDVRRERNRVAAARCRQRKVDKIWVLEERVNELKMENEVLAQHAAHLRHTLYGLRLELTSHLQSGCIVKSMQRHH